MTDVQRMANKIQISCSTLLIFLAVVNSITFSQESGSCLQNCSWTSYSNTKEVQNGCEMLIQQDKVSKWPSCPNIYESYPSDFTPKVEIVGVSYYDYSAKGASSLSGYSSVTDDDTTLMCVNISFQIEQSGADLVKAIRLTLIPETYTDVGKVYCQVWNMTTQLNGCSFSAGHCDANHQYTFYYDCFCELGASQGKHNISVDALPKKSGQNHHFVTFDAPTCEDHPTNMYCQQTPKEHWTPLHASSKQWCNDTTVNVTFDLAPWEYSVEQYYIFLYPSDKNCSIKRGDMKETLITASNIETFKQEYLNQTFNMTTVIFEDLEYGETYIAGFRIADDDGTYYLKRKCSSMVTMEYPPCSRNPCTGHNETCIPECLMYTCKCEAGLERVDQTCQSVSADPIGLDPLYIWIMSAVGGLLMALSLIVATVCRAKGKSCMRGGGREDDPLISPPVELPESPRGSHSMPNGIRLVCNVNTQLQNFADKLRRVLQNHIGCPVSVHTVWHTSQVGTPSWVAEAKNREEKVFFIWDKNLSILDYGGTQCVGTTSRMVHQVISSLQRNELASVVLLQLDVADSAPLPIELRHCCTFSLPGGLMELVKDFSPEAEIPPDSFSEVISSYEQITNNLRQNVCQSSKQTWICKPGNNLEEEQDENDVASDESELSDQEVSIDEEEAGQELLCSLSQSC